MSTTDITKRARGEFDAGQVELIRNTVAKGCNNAELAMFLEVCARNNLDPLTKQIWTMKIKGVMQPVISRDGLLAIANRYTGKDWDGVNGEFLGCSSNVIHDHDLFSFEYEDRDDETIKVKVTHSPRDADGNPTHGGKDGEGRGPIVGAWARVKRRGHDDTFYLAYRKEHDKGENVWKSHPHAMMQKVPEAMTLRKAFSVSGVLGEHEMTERGTVTSTATESAPAVIQWPSDPQLSDELQSAFRALEYTDAKIRLAVNGKPEDELRALLADLNREADEVIPDAEVVE